MIESILRSIKDFEEANKYFDWSPSDRITTETFIQMLKLAIENESNKTNSKKA